MDDVLAPSSGDKEPYRQILTVVVIKRSFACPQISIHFDLAVKLMIACNILFLGINILNNIVNKNMYTAYSWLNLFVFFWEILTIEIFINSKFKSNLDMKYQTLVSDLVKILCILTACV